MWRRDGIVLQPAAQFGGLSWQVAEAWPLLEDVLRLAQHSTGATGVAETDVAAGQLEQGLGRYDGQRVAQQGSQASGPGDVVPGALQVTPVQGAARHERVHQGT